MSSSGSTRRKGLLLDTTLCVGCGACYLACKEKNGLPRACENPLDDELSARTYTVVKASGGRYVRRMCMHCETPTCVSVCPVLALEKTELGPVVYHEDRCMGCRYCMQACPFFAPKYEWEKLMPLVRKCDLCADRLQAGLPTACAGACPTGATTFGDRDALIEEAHARIRSGKRKYVDHIFGVEEVGGTSVLLISDVPFETLGYKSDLPKHPLPLLTWEVLERVPGFAAVGGVILGGIWWITRRRMEVAEAAAREKGVSHEEV